MYILGNNKEYRATADRLDDKKEGIFLVSKNEIFTDLLNVFKKKTGQQSLALNKILLVLMSENEYTAKIYDLVQSVKKAHNKICYICLSKTYLDVVEELTKEKIDIKFFFFVDVLSSHYAKPDPSENCIFVDSPDNLVAIKDAIESAIEKENCSVLLFDTFSSLLIYQPSFPLLRFTHQLGEKNAIKIFIALKKDSVPEKDNTQLINDLKMFADKTIDLG